MTSEQKESGLWFDATHTEFYLIPTDVSPANGEIQLNNFFGETINVSPTELNKFAVSKEVAKEHLKKQILLFFSDMRQNIFEYFDKINRTTETVDTQANPPTAETSHPPKENKSDPSVTKIY